LREFVLDCSVTLSWCFPDEKDSYSMAVREATRTSTVHVPSLWSLELANVLLVAERKGRLTQADSAQFLLILKSLPIHEDTAPAAARMPDVLALGRRYGLSAYDAAYLELAIRISVPIATLDERLKAAARESGVGVYEA
jgi:predicted nucleic acid-binding protein